MVAVNIQNDTEADYLVCLRNTHQGGNFSLLKRNDNRLSSSALEKVHKSLAGGGQQISVQSAHYCQRLEKYLIAAQDTVHMIDLNNGKTEVLLPNNSDEDGLRLSPSAGKQVLLHKNMIYFLTSTPFGISGIDLETRVPLEEIYPLETSVTMLAFTMLGKEQHYQQMKHSYDSNTGVVKNPKIFYCATNLKVTEFDINADGKRLKKNESYFLQSGHMEGWNNNAFAVHPRYMAWSENSNSGKRRVSVSNRRDLKQVSRVELPQGSLAN